MKIKLPIIMALFVCGLSAHAAQDKTPMMPDLRPVIEQMNLDSDQAGELSKLVKAHHENIRAQHKEKDDLRNKMHLIREAHRDELLSVLSYEQFYQFEQYMRQFKRGRKNDLADR
jgi:hypothetical protein